MTHILRLYIDLKYLYPYLWKPPHGFMQFHYNSTQAQKCDIRIIRDPEQLPLGSTWIRSGLDLALSTGFVHTVGSYITPSHHSGFSPAFYWMVLSVTPFRPIRRELLISEPQCDLQSDISCCRTSVRILCLDEHVVALVSASFISADRPQTTSTAVSIWTTEEKRRLWLWFRGLEPDYRQDEFYQRHQNSYLLAARSKISLHYSLNLFNLVSLG